jgi:hypothetical protein
MCN